MRKDRAAAQLRAATTSVLQVELGDQIALYDSTLRALGQELDGIEQRLKPLAPTTGVPLHPTTIKETIDVHA